MPTPSASFLSFSRFSGAQSTFRSGQIGGGFNPVVGTPLYLEAYLGYQNYSPEFLLSGPVPGLDVSARWSSYAVTGGVGWDFALNQYWVLRPVVNLSLGRIAADANLSGQNPPGGGNTDLDFLKSGDITAGGYGGAVMLVYKRYLRTREVDFSLRYSEMMLHPIGGSSDLNAKARITTATALGRVRIPIQGWQAFGKPVKAVFQGSLSSFPGDQGDVVNLDWLGKVGVGVEIGTVNTGVPYLAGARLMLSYAFSDDYDGYSIGLGVSF
ncbi:hypothetical protein ACFMPD_13150 [Sedimentitalea sp. HM32M-2]|uniref:hypothetical protein n=1 Tax=Sedimentitalea sp. HM32M-2 TaxID=3351566 RepID=UPI003642BAE8